MQEAITNGVVAVVKFVAYYVIWSLVLFNLGRASLLVATLGRYPHGLEAQRQVNQISLVGVLVLVLAWTAVAVYNNTPGRTCLTSHSRRTATSPRNSSVRQHGKFFVSMFFTESEFLQVKQFVCLTVANKLRIPDAEFKAIDELQAQILLANQSLAAALAAFLSAYDAWYQFHLRIDASGKAGKLDGAETAELLRLVQERDSTRSSLIKGLASAVV